MSNEKKESKSTKTVTSKKNTKKVESKTDTKKSSKTSKTSTNGTKNVKKSTKPKVRLPKEEKIDVDNQKLEEKLKDESIAKEKVEQKQKESVVKAKLEKEEVPVVKEKVESKEEPKKALFIQRLFAYIIDLLLVSTIAAMIAFPFVNNDTADKLSAESLEVIEKYSNSDINFDTYATEMMSLTYQMAKNSGLVSLITLACEILYFVVFQLYNNGQTIGKKLLKIKVVSNKKDLTMNQMICRSLIINSILLELLSFALMLFATKSVYFYGVATLEMIQYIIVIASAFMVMFRLDGCGVHDKIANTKVIKI